MLVSVSTMFLMLLQLVILAAVTNTILIVHQFLSKEREEVPHYDIFEGKIHHNISKNRDSEIERWRPTDLSEDEATRLQAKAKLIRQEEIRERNAFFQSNLRQISYYEERIQQIEERIQQKKKEQKIRDIDGEDFLKVGEEIDNLQSHQTSLIDIVNELIDNQGESRRKRERKEAASMMEKLGYTTSQSQSSSASQKI